jgi:hypothetical protein
MPDFPSVTNFINSPPGQLVAGAALAGIVWKFFERVEAVLTDQTKHQIARWLRVRNVDTGLLVEQVEPWPETFAKVFDRVFGLRYLSWKSFLTCCLVSVIIFLAFFFFASSFPPEPIVNFWVKVAFVSGIMGANFVSLLQTRLFLGLMRRSKRSLWVPLMTVDIGLSIMWPILFTLLFIPLLYTLRGYWIWSIDLPYEVLRAMGTEYKSLVISIWRHLGDFANPFPLRLGEDINAMGAFYLSSLFASLWLWLYAGSGFLIKTANRLDIGFAWFNRHFDIEKKPLSAIGLVSGVLVALIYWASVILSWVIHHV